MQTDPYGNPLLPGALQMDAAGQSPDYQAMLAQQLQAPPASLSPGDVARSFAGVAAPAPLTISTAGRPGPDAGPFDPEGTGAGNYDPNAGPLMGDAGPGLRAIGSSLVSGHAAQDYQRLVDPEGRNAHGVSGFARSFSPGAIVAGTADAATNGARFIDDMLKGRYGTDFTDPDVVEKAAPQAFNLAMMMGGAGMPMAEEGSAGIFGGKLAATANPEMLEEAKALKSLEGTKWGATPEQALQDTGWFRGRDGDWRFEISDHDAALKPDAASASTLGDALDHPNLYAAYPDMAKISLRSYNNTRGVYNPNINSIGVNSNLNDVERLSVMLHELQHAVQYKEGFQSGSDPYSLVGGYNAYTKTAGEVEARNTQARQSLLPDQRLSSGSLPWDTMDVPAEQQLTAPRELGEPYIKPPTGHPGMGVSMSMPVNSPLHSALLAQAQQASSAAPDPLLAALMAARSR